MKRFFAIASLIALTSTAATATPAETAAPTATEAGQEKEAGVAALVTGVTESANNLQAALDRFGSAMSDAKTQDAGMKALNEMLEAARGVNESLNQDSEIWVELQGLIDEWTKKRDSVSERARNNPGLLPLAARWQEKLDRVVELRTSILDQATDSEILIQDIENKKEVIAEYYELDAIDQVLAEMQVMNDELASMNESMRVILEKTVGVEEGQVPATN